MVFFTVHQFPWESGNLLLLCSCCPQASPVCCDTAFIWKICFEYLFLANSNTFLYSSFWSTTNFYRYRVWTATTGSVSDCFCYFDSDMQTEIRNQCQLREPLENNCLYSIEEEGSSNASIPLHLFWRFSGNFKNFSASGMKPKLATFRMKSSDLIELNYNPP